MEKKLQILIEVLSDIEGKLTRNQLERCMLMASWDNTYSQFQEMLKDQTSTELTILEQTQIRRGCRIPAIKQLRSRTGMPLKDAKEIVDAWAHKHVETERE